MIIKEFQLENLITKNNQSFNILIYGPNEGLVKDHVENILQNFLNKEEYEHVSFSGKDLDSNPDSLDSVIRTVSMFYKNKIIVADDIKDKHLSIIENVVKKVPHQSFFIVREGNLNKSSKIRKFFENDEKCFSLACYEDDGRAIIKNIDEFIKRNNLELSRDIKNYLLQSLSNDRMVSKRELEKIEIFYSNSNIKIELNDIKILLNDSSSLNLNKMNENVMFGNTSKSSKIINKLLSEGLSPISLIRSLTNYLLRIQKTKVEMKKGNSFDHSIKTLKPPIFWKDKDNFQKHCLKWPLNSIETNLFNLLETEIACKLNSKVANVKCEKSILSIANNGRQYFKN